MTTMSIQDELERLGKATAADVKKAEVQARIFRPDSRPDVVSGHAYIELSIEPRSGVRQDGTSWSSEALVIHFSKLSNVKVAPGRMPFTSSSFDYEMPYKDEPHHTSQQALTLKAVGESIGEPGATLKVLHKVEADFEEVAIPPRVDKDGNIRKTKGSDGNYYNERPTFYYRFYNLSGTSGDISTPTATVEGEEIACAVAAGKTDAELTPNNFLTAFSAAGGTDPVVQAEIAGRKFLARMVGEGKLNKLEDGAYALN